MTEEQKFKIIKLRSKGISYSDISKEIGMSVNTIKAFCQRNQLGGIGRNIKKDANITTQCECCGSPIKQIKGRKHKRFCSDKCRNKWWNSHLDLVKREANYDCTCRRCGKHFITYGNKNRKYCSRECYSKYRFGGK